MNYISTQSARIMRLNRRGQERMRTIVIIAPPGVVPSSLKQAAEDAFPWIAIEEVSHVDKATRIFANTVSLLLIHTDFLAEAERYSSELFRNHPMALISALDDSPDGKGAAERVIGSPLVRSVLPLKVRHEVTLSILSLLLQGIEYFPRAMMEAALQAPTPVEPPPPAPEPQAVPAHLRMLTKREIQVLELVQRGLQNKSIANDLNLSGHTVKIHLHNIIGKLGARNRTEASAIYRNGGVPAAHRAAEPH